MIKKLTDYSHLRKRVAMYLGSDQPHTQNIVMYDKDLKPYVKELTWTPALFTCLREITDNALDEIVGHGFGNRIDITFDPDSFVFTVRDNGRGIPISYDASEKMHLVTMVLTQPRTGRNFDERGEVAGVNGIGSAAVSNTSEWFSVEVIRDGKKFKQMFREGIFGATELDILKPKITDIKSDKTGTYIEFKPSSEVFKSRILPEDFVRSRIVEMAICNPSLKIYYNNELIKVKPKQEQTLFPNMKPITIDIEDENFKSRFWITYGNDGSEHIHSLVNNIPVFNGGVHVDAFRRQFYNNLIAALQKESKKRKLQPNRSDIQDGLFIYNITNMLAPNFDSQSKTRLINEEVASIFKKQLEDPILYKDLIRKNSEWINAIYERCAAQTMKKDAADLSKLNKTLKRQKVEKLNDATGRDRTKCILLLAEGDCLHDDTDILVIDNGETNVKRIGDVEVGDLVISHSNNICRVNAVSNKIASTITINTSAGTFSGTDKHRMLCHDRSDNLFKWVMLGDMVKGQHRLVRNRIADLNRLATIVSNTGNPHEIYNRKIVFADKNGDEYYELASSEHSYGVLDVKTMSYKKVRAIDINPKLHLLLVKA